MYAWHQMIAAKDTSSLLDCFSGGRPLGLICKYVMCEGGVREVLLVIVTLLNHGANGKEFFQTRLILG